MAANKYGGKYNNASNDMNRWTNAKLLKELRLQATVHAEIDGWRRFHEVLSIVAKRCVRNPNVRREFDYDERQW